MGEEKKKKEKKQERKKELIFNASDSMLTFDLDYSQKEIENTQKLREEDAHCINRKTLRDLVTEHPFFEKFFYWLRYSDRQMKKHIQQGNAIPVELLPFFKLYMMEVRSKKGKSSVVRKAKVPDGMEESFYGRLLEYARTEERKNNLDESEIYWTRCLYEDEGFQKAAVGELWDEEYMFRAKGLYEKVKKLPPERQLAMFQNVISFLDAEIILASSEVDQNSANVQGKGTDLERFLDEFPRKVICRNRKRIIQKDDGNIVKYVVDNMVLTLTVESDNSNDDETSPNAEYLYDALLKIRRNKGDMLILKKDTREKYLRKLNQKVQKSQFQLDYEKSRAYINACTSELTSEELRKRIEDRAVAYFGSAFRGKMVMPGYFSSDPDNKWEQSEMNRLIEDYVTRHYDAFCYKNKSCLDFINNSRDVRDGTISLMSNLAHYLWDDPEKMEDESEYQEYLTMYIEYLDAVMPEALRNEFRPGELVDTTQQQVLSERIVELSLEAFQKLRIEPMEWADVDTLKTAFSAYNSEMLPKEGPKLPPGFIQPDVILQKALITIKVGEVLDNCCREVERSITTLIAAIKEMKN